MIFLFTSLVIIALLYWLADYGLKQMERETESYDEYIAEQASLSYEINKQFSVKPNKLTAINAVKANHEN